MGVIKIQMLGDWVQNVAIIFQGGLSFLQNPSRPNPKLFVILKKIKSKITPILVYHHVALKALFI